MSDDTTNDSGSTGSTTSETDGSLPDTPRKEPTMSDLDRRMARIESRIVQLMLHMGLNPYEKAYDASKQFPRPLPRQRVPSRR